MTNTNDEEQQVLQEATHTTLSSPTPPVTIEANASRDPYLALRYRDFRLIFIGVFIAAISEQMLNVAIGWELYQRTNSALSLGLVGLVLVLPVIVLALPAGHIVDRVNRKHIMIAAQFFLALGALALTALSFIQGPLPLIYGCLLLMGAAWAFSNPASTTLEAQTVPENAFSNAATWSSSSWQLASVVGPALGGFMIALSHGAALVYAFNAAAALLLTVLLLQLRVRPRTQPVAEKTTLGSLVGGVKFLLQEQVLLAAITLDLFAVLLGGATMLLPIFARDILHVGPAGLGWLRAAPSVGAICVAFCIAHVPSFKRAGRTLLLAVAGFGAATILFGLSHSFWLSLLLLFFMGGLDNISVVIRSTLLLTRTPDAMRGRVSAINSLFIAASNELGGFESGVAAQLFGPIIAVAGGGVSTVLVVAAIALLWPQLRRLGTL